MDNTQQEANSQANTDNKEIKKLKPCCACPETKRVSLFCVDETCCEEITAKTSRGSKNLVILCFYGQKKTKEGTTRKTDF